MNKNLQIHETGLLFEQVQLNSVFPDNKTFVDCLPKFDLQEIQQKFLSENDQKNFSLKAFVLENFDLPKAFSSNYKSDKNKSAKEHIEALWGVLTRQPDDENSSIISLPNPYVVPGGRFGEIYYWDSYFTMLGLQISDKIDLIENMIDNFAFLINEFGYIPNGNRTYFLGRSQPPFFSLMVKLLSESTYKKVLLKYLPKLVAEYNFWMKDSEILTDKNNASRRVVRMKDCEILNRYFDENDSPRPESFREDVELSHDFKQKTQLFRNLRAACESGWDFSSRWFRDENDFKSIHTTDIIPVDLNCLLFHLEETLAESFLLINDKMCQYHFIGLIEAQMIHGGKSKSF